jgi:predicted nucleic acid-binding protein
MLVMQEKVYVDTSSLIILNKINALDLLNKIYSNVIITNYIQLELNEAIPSWISVELTYNIDQSFLKNFNLGLGETSIIINAIKNNGFLIIDDLKARKIATTLRLRFTGSIGILIIAKELKLIDSVKYYLENIQETNFRLSDALINKVLEITNEK